MSKKIYSILAILFATITASLGIIILIYAKTITAIILYLLTICLTSLTSLMFVGAVLKSNPQNTEHTSNPQSNYIECHNCTEHYDCERTYLGGCTDGKAYEQPARMPLYNSESMVHCNLVTCYEENYDLKVKNAELQKQADKAWFEVGKMCMEERKDTAKEILDKAIIIDKNTGNRGFICIEALTELCKSKGVEVE